MVAGKLLNAELLIMLQIVGYDDVDGFQCCNFVQIAESKLHELGKELSVELEGRRILMYVGQKDKPRSSRV